MPRREASDYEQASFLPDIDTKPKKEAPHLRRLHEGLAPYLAPPGVQNNHAWPGLLLWKSQIAGSGAIAGCERNHSGHPSIRSIIQSVLYIDHQQGGVVAHWRSSIVFQVRLESIT